MDDITDAEIEAALARGQQAEKNEPVAVSARYDSRRKHIIVELSNGCTFTFPAHKAQGLELASTQQLAAVEVLGAGYGLHWEDLDIDLSVPGLMAELFGTKKYMAKLGGSSTSAAKAAAARTNGVKGGRPRKQAKVLVPS